MLVIPAIDIKDGRCVRLLQGRFDDVTDYSADAAGIARRYAGYGAPWLHVVDLDGAEKGVPGNRQMIREIIDASAMDIQVGGGIRTKRAALSWFEAGVSRVVIGSITVTEPTEVTEWLVEFGPDRVVLALDVRLSPDGIPHVTTHGWTEDTDLTLNAAIEAFKAAGLKHVLCTDVSRDGAMAGPNTALYQAIAAAHPSIRLQASGGVRNAADLQELAAGGACAAIVGKALLDGEISAEELTPFLRDE